MLVCMLFEVIDLFRSYNAVIIDSYMHPETKAMVYYNMNWSCYENDRNVDCHKNLFDCLRIYYH